MSKKGIIVSLVIASFVFFGVVAMKEKTNKQKVDEKIIDSDIVQNLKNPKKLEKPSELHSDILRLIESSDTPIATITPAAAKKELEARAGKEVLADKKKPNLSELPFEILRAISRSPASVAGINPKRATTEIISMYLLIDAEGSGNFETFTPSMLLKTLKNHDEKIAIEKWAKNEDAEAVDKFMKEEANNNPSSVANFAYGLHLKGIKIDEAQTYMDRFVASDFGDEFNNQDETKSYEELVHAIKNLKANQKKVK